MKIFSTYKFKFVAVVIAFVAVLTFMITFMAIRLMERNAMDVFRGIASTSIEDAMRYVDVEKVMRLSASLDDEDSYYVQTCAAFKQVRETHGCSYVYVMVPVTGSESECMYVLDGSADFVDGKLVETEDFSPVGTVEDISSSGKYPYLAMEKQELVVASMSYDETWGWNISVYYPLVSSAGKSVGFLACDFDVTALAENLRSVSLLLVSLASGIAVLGIGTLVLLVLAFFKRLSGVSSAMANIAGGARDLTARLPLDDNTELSALSGACNMVMAQLQDMMLSLFTSIDSLSENTQVISQQNQERMVLIQEAEEAVKNIFSQAESQKGFSDSVAEGIDKVNSAIDVLDEKIAQQVNAVAQSTQTIKKINENISSVAESIKRISTEYTEIVSEASAGQKKQEEVSSKVSVIAQQSDGLAEANQVISNIAEQTNLLAMNAAIEAAHAGDAGKGFSVVADEIRALAETSSEQTKAITKLIYDIQEAVAGIVEASNGSFNSFNQLEKKIVMLDASLQEVHDGMEEQSRNAHGVMEMIDILNSVEQAISQSADIMKKEADSVEEQITDLKACSYGILESGENAAGQLSRLSDYARQTSSKVAENVRSLDSVETLVSTFKVK